MPYILVLFTVRQCGAESGSAIIKREGAFNLHPTIQQHNNEKQESFNKIFLRGTHDKYKLLSAQQQTQTNDFRSLHSSAFLRSTRVRPLINSSQRTADTNHWNIYVLYTNKKNCRSKRYNNKSQKEYFVSAIRLLIIYK